MVINTCHDFNGSRHPVSRGSTPDLDDGCQKYGSRNHELNPNPDDGRQIHGISLF